MSSRPASSATATVPARPGRGATINMGVMGLMMAGAGTVDAITGNMLPITARHFTDNIALISFMIALNRIGGFVVQPYAAWKSDRWRSRHGRRRPFLLAAWPTVFVSVALLGALPFVVPLEYRGVAAVVVTLFAVNLAMQASLDVCYGAGDPMYGDMFPSGSLGQASGVRAVVTSIVGIAMTFVFIPLADRHEFWPYAGALFFVAISWTAARFHIRESVPADVPKPERYNPLKPLVELRDPHVRKVAIVASVVLVALALTEMLHALFVTETLGLSKTALGRTQTAGFVLSLLLSYPIGWVTDRIGPRTVLIAGLALVVVTEAGFVFWVDDLVSLYVCVIGFKVSYLVAYMPIVPLMFEHAPKERRGSIFAAVQTTRAAVTSAATVGAGMLVDVTGSYRVCYLVVGLLALAGVVVAFRFAPIGAAPPLPQRAEV